MKVEIIMGHVWHSAYTERALNSIGSVRRLHLIDKSFAAEMRIYALRHPHINYVRPDVRFRQEKNLYAFDPGTCSSSWNIGMSVCCAEWVLNINPDVEVKPGYIEAYETMIDARPDGVKLLVSDIGFNVWMGHVPTLKELGGFDGETFWPQGGEDEDMLVRLAQAGHKWTRFKSSAYHMDGGHLQRSDGYRNVETFRQKWGFKPQSPEYKEIVGGARA